MVGANYLSLCPAELCRIVENHLEDNSEALMGAVTSVRLDRDAGTFVFTIADKAKRPAAPKE